MAAKNRIKPATIALLLSTACSLSCLAWLCFEKVSAPPSPNKIFSSALKSVFEVRSTFPTGNTYGSCVQFSDNLMVTNYHVIARQIQGISEISSSIEIRPDFKENYFKCSFLFGNEDYDIAFLKLTESIKETKTISLASTFTSGEICYAVGNGLNYGISIAQGLISRKYVSIANENGIVTNMILASVSTNEGNSGGALLNAHGDLIGITTMRILDSAGTGSTEMALSIPASYVSQVKKEYGL